MCDILSKSTESENHIKMPIYARYGVDYAWLLDPLDRILEADASDASAWREIRRFGGDDRVAVAPFAAVSVHLRDLWVPLVSGPVAR